MSDDKQSRIGKRAFEIWQREGCPDGRSAAHWQQAEAEIVAEEADAPSPKKKAPPKPRQTVSKAKSETRKAEPPKKAVKKKK
ncbi:MAG: DUF2934 domain-containing protein [Rhodospirillales bacterium]|nr:DUF2934 domain-containing protein [Rhodospirillales bacterium]